MVARVFVRGEEGRREREFFCLESQTLLCYLLAMPLLKSPAPISKLHFCLHIHIYTINSCDTRVHLFVLPWKALGNTEHKTKNVYMFKFTHTHTYFSNVTLFCFPLVPILFLSYNN